MAKPPKAYTRVTRNAAGLGSYSSLWLAADHLLIVRSNGYTESYSRVQLHEIKGFFLTPSSRRAWWGAMWGVVAAIGAMMLMSAIANGGNPAWSLIFLVPGVAGLVWNYSMGPGCRGYVVTGVQTAELPALRRMKKAHRVLAQLQPLIEAAQTDLALPPVIVQPPVMAAVAVAAGGIPSTMSTASPATTAPGMSVEPPAPHHPPAETRPPPGATPPTG
jgi:hypothetical protein